MRWMDANAFIVTKQRRRERGLYVHGEMTLYDLKPTSLTITSDRPSGVPPNAPRVLRGWRVG